MHSAQRVTLTQLASALTDCVLLKNGFNRKTVASSGNLSLRIYYLNSGLIAFTFRLWCIGAFAQPNRASKDTWAPEACWRYNVTLPKPLRTHSSQCSRNSFQIWEMYLLTRRSEPKYKRVPLPRFVPHRKQRGGTAVVGRYDRKLCQPKRRVGVFSSPFGSFYPFRWFNINVLLWRRPVTRSHCFEELRSTGDKLVGWSILDSTVSHLLFHARWLEQLEHPVRRVLARRLKPAGCNCNQKPHFSNPSFLFVVTPCTAVLAC